MTNDDTPTYQEDSILINNANLIANKLEDLAHRLRQGCASPTSLQLIEESVTEWLEVYPENNPQEENQEETEIFQSALNFLSFIENLGENSQEDSSSNDENSGSESDEDNITDKNIVQLLFRGWYFTMMASAIHNQSQE